MQCRGTELFSIIVANRVSDHAGTRPQLLSALPPAPPGGSQYSTVPHSVTSASLTVRHTAAVRRGPILLRLLA